MKKFLFIFCLLLGAATGAFAQAQRTITGVVRSATEALPGVTVLVKGTTKGASTDPEGRFSIIVPTGQAVTLSVSSIGYVSQEIAVGDRDQINVTLKEDAQQLNDVVVIGYQEVNRRDVTGSVSSVSAQQIKDVPVNSAAEALTGRLAGVQLTASEGAPGADVRIRVRGGGSITQDNSPLYVVDGIQVENALSNLSPQDIASVDVLKDASATAIYGARGANGVVIITTKSGREGKTVVSYNGFAGFRQLSKKLDVLSPADYIDYQYERAANIGATELNNFRNVYGSRNFLSDTLNAIRNAPFRDWQNEVFGRRAFMQTHNVSVAGGGKGTTFSLSLTGNQEQGIQLESGFNRKLANFRFDHKVTEKFRVGFNVRYNDQETKGAGTSSAGTVTTSRLRNTVQYRPFDLDLTNAAGPDQFDEAFLVASSLTNPIITNESEYRRDKRRLTNLSGFFSLELAKNLVFRSTAGFDHTNRLQQQFNGRFSPSIRASNYAGLPFLIVNNSTDATLNLSNVLTYRREVERHSFDVLLGQEIYQQSNTGVMTPVSFLPLDISAEQAFANINQAVTPPTYVQPTSQSGESMSRILSGFARANYSFADKYLLTATVRADGSSKFAPGNRIGIFPAGSVAWRISQEEFFKPFINTVSDMKLRVSYGLAGNNRIQDFGYLTTFGTNNAQYALGETVLPGLAPNALAYPDLRWETTVSRNLGLDLSLFNNRVQFSADAYKNSTRDLLVAQPIPVTSGYNSQLRNIGRTSNLGLELQLGGTVIQTPDFTWTANGNISFNRNQIDELGSLNNFLILSGWSPDPGSDYIVQVGRPVGQMYGYETDNFYTLDDFNYNTATGAYVLKEGVVTNATVLGQAPQPGTLKFKDLDGDGNITQTGDRGIIGNANPKHVGGLNQQFSYKGFDASIFLNWVYGNDVYNANKIEFTGSFYNGVNMLDINKDRWRTIDASGNLVTDPTALAELNKDAKIWQPFRSRYLFHSWAVEDGSFLRLNNLTLGYTLPKALIERAKLTQLRFYVTMNNLYTLTSYSGYDPEVNTRRGTPLTPGVDHAAYPRSRAFLFGVNLSL